MTDRAALDIRIERMQLADLPAIMEIEAVSFPAPWPLEAYQHELTRNSAATYFVARRRRTVSRCREGPDRATLVGYAGLWLQYDEAHISTIAVHPDWRGRRIGERMLTRLIEHAIESGMAALTLEVRVSNLAAQGLYRKFGFGETGRRKAYYADAGEDALIMTTPAFADPEWRADLDRHRRRLARWERPVR